MFKKYLFLIREKDYPLTTLRAKNLRLILFNLGGGREMDTPQLINDMRPQKKKRRILLCDMRQIDRDTAIEASQRWNCNVIDENWVVWSIYPNDPQRNTFAIGTETLDSQDSSLVYNNDSNGPIMKPLPLPPFDCCNKEESHDLFA